MLLKSYLRCLVVALGACASSADSERAPCSTAQLALFNASPDAGALPLSSAQAGAIGAIINSDTGAPLCSITRIAVRHAVTAAHCVRAPNAMLRFGSHAGTLEAARAVVHPELDVALVELGADLRAAMGGDAIALLDESISGDWLGASLTLSGTGRDELGQYGELRFVQESIVKVTDTELWVDGEGKSGACGGDSGGPVLVQDRSGTVRVAGTLDRGSPDCLGVDVYIRADVIANWARATRPDALAPPPEALSCP